MKTKSYKYGKFTFKAQHKKIGHGWEISLVCNRKPVFVGNFVHTKEANQWWTLMNKELTGFTNRFWVAGNVSSTFYANFISAHLNKHYYSFLDKAFNKYNREFSSKWNKDVRRYNQLKKRWSQGDKVPTIKAA